ncbi:hypothetical protein M1P97_19885 [Parabacteroides sp. GYB001]|uniref:hypothetical protein n=1 Tax=Parabacteroides leei TaxID=2939491 RepID=UPI0020178A69|nr:hypothetical protein [Parabacteroides leei]MCL3853547.1 hypothetical protein [Parabacteroides leei]
MKEFCNTIQLFLLQDIQSFRENVITLKPGRSYVTISTDDFTLTPKEETSEAGTLYNIEEDITTEKVTVSVASTYKIRRSAILKLETQPDHSPVFIGSQEWPAQISITTHLNKDTLHIHSKMQQSPL